MRKEITSRNGKHNGKIFKLSQCISSQMEKKNSIQTKRIDLKKSSINA